MTRMLVTLGALALALAVASCAQAAVPLASRPAAQLAPATPSGPTEIARVLTVVDGDTIRVDRGRGSERVRYIGIDTPETGESGSPTEPLAVESTEANRRLVEGREVILERDVSETDRFGRLLRYVWIREGEAWTLVNLVLVEQGYAQVATFPPDVRYADELLAAQRRAMDAGAGLWAQR